jgi:predicted ATPase with chaperone activity
MVGLPETAVRESKERVRSALLTPGFSFPPGRITVNLSIGTNHVSEAVKLRALDRLIC